MVRGSYHHGSLRAAVLEEAALMIAQEGVGALTLRELARRAGVSHAAPAHHFGDRRGLLTALAVAGFGLLARELAAAGDDFRAVAVAYVLFATRHPGHYAVMYRGDLLNSGDLQLVAAQVEARHVLTDGVAGVPPEQRRGRAADAPLAAWAMVHGLASLWLDGALSDSTLTSDTDVQELTGRIADVLFGPSPASQ